MEPEGARCHSKWCHILESEEASGDGVASAPASSFTLLEDSVSLMAQGCEPAVLSSALGERLMIKTRVEQSISRWTCENQVALVVCREESWWLAWNPDFYTFGILHNERILH